MIIGHPRFRVNVAQNPTRLGRKLEFAFKRYYVAVDVRWKRPWRGE